MFDPWVVLQLSWGEGEPQSSEWVLYREQMLSSQAAFKAASYGVLFLAFLPGRGTELSSAWYGCSKTFRGLTKEETNSDGSGLSRAQPKAALNLSCKVTWSRGPKGFVRGTVGDLRLALGCLNGCCPGSEGGGMLWDLGVTSSLVWDGRGLRCCP